MPKYTFILARDRTESATVTIEADTIAAAQEVALSYAFEDQTTFTVDDCGYVSSTFLPNADDYEVAQ